MHSYLEIEMQVNLLHFHTNIYPNIIDILKVYHPSVLQTICHNPQNLPFSLEVQNTELGHLYEHILLAYLTDIQSEKGNVSIYNGRTTWDWYKDKEGLFHIYIDVGRNDEGILAESLEKSNKLFSEILRSNHIGNTKTKQIAN